MRFSYLILPGNFFLGPLTSYHVALDDSFEFRKPSGPNFISLIILLISLLVSSAP